MPKKPKSEEVEKGDTWSEDQKDHEYYYDDAHGYEKYEPEEEEEEVETGRRGDDLAPKVRGNLARANGPGSNENGLSRNAAK